MIILPVLLLSDETMEDRMMVEKYGGEEKEPTYISYKRIFLSVGSIATADGYEDSTSLFSEGFEFVIPLPLPVVVEKLVDAGILEPTDAQFRKYLLSLSNNETK